MLTAATVLAQTARVVEPPNSITGTVMTDDGRPAARVSVLVYSTGRNPVRRSSTTDDDGRFQFTDLPEAAYRVSASSRGYVTDTIPGESQFHVPGESVSITLRKGGVITGKVLTSSGEPVIEAPMTFSRIRDAEGHRAPGSGPFTITDDRGIYRGYGLSSGIYLVSVGGMPQAGGRTASLASDIRTYYPSSSRVTAVQVTVRAGEEVAGIDIRLRGERGRTISGTVLGRLQAGARSTGVRALLIDHSSQELLGSSTDQPETGGSGFEFVGVADGDYDIVATGGFVGSDTVMTSAPRRVLVKGADISGIELTLLPSASLSGKVRIDPAGRVCAEEQKVAIQEMILQIRRESSSNSGVTPGWLGSYAESAVDRLGDFGMTSIRAGRYQLVSFLPGASLYLRSVTIQTAGGLRDLAKDGITLAAGDRVSGLMVAVAPGAASLKGSVSNSAGKLLRVHLVPKEPERIDQPVYYYESLVRSDKSFSIDHVAPGTYWVALREVGSDEPLDAPRAAWDARDRARLRAEAEAAKLEIVLQPCQRLTSYMLNYAGHLRIQ